MKKIIHNTKKYDGSIHYNFSTSEILRTESVLVLYMEPGTHIKSYRGEYTGDRRFLIIFRNDRYHNVMISWNKDWSPRCIYVNIATPAVWNNREVSAVDMDLDLFTVPGEKKVYIDDEDEFELHQKKYGYPQELIDRCLAESDHVYKLLQTAGNMFSEDMYSWRPGNSLPFDPVNI